MQRRLRAPAIDFARLRRDMGIVDRFPPDAEAEARAAVDRHAAGRVDRTDLEIVTIDPPGSMDLDQALRVVADGEGFRVHYAIADVAALVTAGGAVDAESRRRGQTVYFPDGSVPLHPRALSEDAGSLLPDEDRPAVLWTVDVDAGGDVLAVHVERALVRSRARLDYAGVMADLAADQLHPAVAGLPDFGRRRLAWALERGAVQLDLPDQEIVPHSPGRAWTLRIAPHTPADQWNAQVSLLIGMAAGRIQADAGVGLLRTLPPPADSTVHDLRDKAAHLGVDWPADESPGEFLARLEPDAPSTLALMTAGASLMRGAGYRALDADSAAGPVADLEHAGVGGIYSHVTAPLRRLADRFATEVCLSVTAGDAVPEWVIEALQTLPKIMSGSDAVAGTAERKSVDLTEAVVLADQIGATFDAVVTRAATDKRPAEVFIETPAITAPCDDAPEPGTRCTVKVTTADPTVPEVRFIAV